MGRELEQRTGARFVLSDLRIATRPVSATFKGLPLQEGIKKILAGFSYAIYPDAESGKVIISVLATPEDPASKKPAAALGSGSAAQVFGNALFPPATNAGMPLPMEEFRSVERELDPEVQAAREQEIQDREHEHQEALLQHVLGVLNSGHSQLHTETLAVLQGMDDPRATEMLIAAASSGDAKDSKARIQAVEILWRHAADLEFRDEASVNALKQLAYDSNSRAAQIARRALQSMEQHQQ